MHVLGLIGKFMNVITIALLTANTVLDVNRPFEVSMFIRSVDVPEIVIVVRPYDWQLIWVNEACVNQVFPTP